MVLDCDHLQIILTSDFIWDSRSLTVSLIDLLFSASVKLIELLLLKLQPLLVLDDSA